MTKKLAKIKYLPNNFKIIEQGDYVICAVSGKKISLENLNYWNVDLQEPYYSYVEASLSLIAVSVFIYSLANLLFIIYLNRPQEIFSSN